MLVLTAQAVEGGGAVPLERPGAASGLTCAERSELDIPNGGVMAREIEGADPFVFRAGRKPGDVILS